MYAIRSYYGNGVVNGKPTGKGVLPMIQATQKAARFSLDATVSSEKWTYTPEAWAGAVPVITSYSIHYTKLYEEIPSVLL